MRISIRVSVVSLILAVAAVQAGPLGPTPYLSFADSPFFSGGFNWFHLETFEDGLFNVPGVSSAGVVYGPASNCDSVDGDDGSIDGFGTNGKSWWSGGAHLPSVTFTFDSGVLGNYPTHVGIAVTDGVNDVEFEAFDAGGNSLGVTTGSHFDGIFTGETAEDRFYGYEHAAGVSKIRVTNQINNSEQSSVEVDHLQYGYRAAVSVEKGTWTAVRSLYR